MSSEDMIGRMARAICNKRLPKPANGDAWENLWDWARFGASEDAWQQLSAFRDEASAALDAYRASGRQPWRYAASFVKHHAAEYDRCDRGQLEDALQEYFAFLELSEVIPIGFGAAADTPTITRITSEAGDADVR